MARILIMGYYGFGNTGDEALLEAILGDLRSRRPDIRAAVLSARPDDTARQHGVEAVNRWQPHAVGRALRRSDLLITGGGSLLQDGTSLRSLAYYAGWILIARALRRPVMLYANGIGPLRTAVGRSLARRALAAADMITLRDRQAERDLLELKPARIGHVEVTADPTFSLLPALPEEADAALRQAGVPPGRPLLGVALRPWPGQERWLDPLVAGIREAAAAAGLLPVLLPMQPSHDLDLGRALHARLPGSSLVQAPLAPRLFMAVLGRMQAVVGMRLHALILAATQAVPVAGVAYDPKVAGFLEEAGQPLLFDLRPEGGAPSYAELHGRIVRFLNDLPALRERLAEQLPDWHRAAGRNAELAIRLLEGDERHDRAE